MVYIMAMVMQKDATRGKENELISEPEEITRRRAEATVMLEVIVTLMTPKVLPVNMTFMYCSL
jgi:hypothetical protein